MKKLRALCSPAVIVAALGYFVDVYDLILFSIVRVPSLQSLGLEKEQILDSGVYLLNLQMAGMLLGGILWGILGDKRGRLSVLFGSILLYSTANLLNAFVTSVDQYAVLRFIAGVGLAGELGAGITLVSEVVAKELRGYATTLVATIGMLGGVFAALIGSEFQWTTAFIIGGVMGLLLLGLRIAVTESGMFRAAENTSVKRGDFTMLFTSWSRFRRYLASILVGVPIWFAVGILMTFAPEVGEALGVKEAIKGSSSVLYFYIGLTAGDLASGVLSQILKSRRKAIFFFLLFTLATSLLLIRSDNLTAHHYYLFLTALGFGSGYWAVFVTVGAEQFGTNLRATVATTVPNLVRGAAIPITQLFVFLKPAYGVAVSAEIVGLLCFSVALASLLVLKESFHHDLDFLEHHEDTAPATTVN